MPLARPSAAAERDTVMTSLALVGFTAFTALVVNLLSARTLGPDGRGEVALALQIAYLCCPVLLLGADRSLLRGRSSLKWPNQRLSVGLLVVLLLCILPASLTRPWIILVVPIALVEVLITLARARGIALRRPRHFAPHLVGYQVAILSGTIVLALNRVTDPTLWLLTYAGPGLIALLVIAMAWSRRSTRPARAKVDKESIRLMPGAIGAIVLARGERLVLPMVAGTYSLGLYVAVATCTEATSWLGQSVADLVSGGRRPGASRFSTEVMVMVSTSLLGTVVGLVLWWVMVPILGSNFSAAKPFILPLVLAAVVLAYYRLLVGKLLASETPAVTSRVESLAAVLAIPVYLAGVLIAGAEGAAWASLAAYITACVLALFASRKISDERAMLTTTDLAAH